MSAIIMFVNMVLCFVSGAVLLHLNKLGYCWLFSGDAILIAGLLFGVGILNGFMGLGFWFEKTETGGFQW